MSKRSRRAGKRRADDLRYLETALALAARGRGRCAPNPMGGAVIVNNDRIVGRGFHKKTGEPHAEALALERAGDRARGATLYLNLEPCSHHGRTPPCADRIIDAGITRVVCCMEDPNPLVGGRGFRKLVDAGIKVETGLLERKARRLNEVFSVNISLKRPFVVLKAAVTLDGSLGGDLAKDAGYITGEAARRKVHALRRDLDAVMIGSGTALADDPELTVRKVKGVNPVRIILDSRLRTSAEARVIKLGAVDGKTLVFHSEEACEQKAENLRKAGGKLESVSSCEDGKKIDLELALEAAYKQGIASILLEGGRKIFTSFFERGLVDKVCWFIAPVFSSAGDKQAAGFFEPAGVKAPSDGKRMKIMDARWHVFGDDVMMEGYTRARLEQKATLTREDTTSRR